MYEPAPVLWFTGLSGSGKSTLAEALRNRLQDAGQACTLLDGDVLRTGLCSDLGFTPEDRAENVRRVTEVARLLSRAGVVTLVALISPYRTGRDRARDRIGPAFREIHLDVPLEACEARDPKGLYRRARAGEIPSFTGIDAPYEAPLAPELRLRTHELPLEVCIDSIAELIHWNRAGSSS